MKKVKSSQAAIILLNLSETQLLPVTFPGKPLIGDL